MKIHIKIFIVFLLFFITIAEPSTMYAEQSGFSDVPKNHWAYHEINALSEKKIISGYPNKTFRPSEKITRAQMAVFIGRATKLNPIKDLEKFIDVKKTHPYYKEITLIQRAGIIEGKDGYYKPNQYITRAEMANILMLAFNLKKTSFEYFKDLDEKHWAYESVQSLYSNGIIATSNGYFRPNEELTRAQFVVFMYRTLMLPKFNLPDLMNNNDAFSEDIDYHKSVLKNPILLKILNEGQDALKKNNVQIIKAGDSIWASYKGYKNPNGFKYLINISSNSDGKSFILTFDFRNQRGINIAKDWLKILLPESNFDSLIQTVSEDASKTEKKEKYFFRDPTHSTIGKYDIRLLVNTEYWHFRIDADYYERPNYMLDNDLFIKNIPYDPETEKKPILNQFLLEGQEIVKNNNFVYCNSKYYSVSICNKNFPIDRYNTDIKVYSGERAHDKTFNLSFDFREEKEKQVGLEILYLLRPEFNLDKEIERLLKEVILLENEGKSFEKKFIGRKIGNYSITLIVQRDGFPLDIEVVYNP
jgi:hypothetical protein